MKNLFLGASLLLCGLSAAVAQQSTHTPPLPLLDTPTLQAQQTIQRQVSALKTGSAMDYYLGLRRSKLRGLTLGQAADAADDKAAGFKPTFSAGALIHVVGAGFQDRPSADPNAQADQEWQRQLFNYRTRLLFGGNVSAKTSWFIETEAPTVDGIGWGAGDTTRNIQVSPIILDAQVEHRFSDAFSIIAGMQLVGINRNQLQGAASLMGVDFGYYQYNYTLTQNSPLQNNYGRDIGVNLRGFFLDNRLEYRLGFFGGRSWDNKGPFRTIARLCYNFLDTETGQYYTGNSLGSSKLFSIGAGVDMQGGYTAFGADAFLDLPVSESLSILANTSYSMLNGGDPGNPYNMGTLIPKQSILFGEVGLYARKLKLSPFFIIEMNTFDGDRAQLGLPESADSDALSDANALRDISRMGGGLCYYFNGYNANIKLQYITDTVHSFNPDGNVVGLSRGVIWAQLQLFVF
ncbi:MAG: hypothetical protein KF690_03350 [Bacteroidetes bacterium]|nr:hypothetical protein [Bacteroidota bacterium]